MHNLHSPMTGDHKIRLKSGRTPLQLKNSPASSSPLTEIQILKPKPKLKPKQQDWIEISVVAESNKENNPIYATTPEKLIIEPLLDASLAEELSAIRKKLERLKTDKEKTEKMLNERSRLLDLQMKEMEERGETQKRLEMEVDRLYRLKQIQSSSSLRISPLRSLREKEHEKKISQANLELKGEEMEESVSAKSPCMSSCSSSNSISSQLVTVK